jgi:FAD-dependent urate hydroxylase
VSDAVDVAIIGAGPYGLSLAAHLEAAGVRYRQFGRPMDLWRSRMPRGMYLKSQGFASNLSSPGNTRSLAAFCRKAAHPYADYGLPVPLDVFIEYGDWFASELAGHVEPVMVSRVDGREGDFRLTTSDNRTATARRVVVATGVEHFAYLPPELSGPDCVSHSSTVTEPADFSGQQVAVIGRGQSALESAALLHENGARAQVITRSPGLIWNGPPLLPDRPWWQRMREPEAGLGSGWATWFYSRQPELFRHLPEQTRIYRARTALGPAGASWLRSRVEGQIPVLTSQAVEQVRAGADGARIMLRGPRGERSDIRADHVIAATGYRPDLGRLQFLDEGLRAGVRTVAGTAAVDASYQTSVPGLYVIGPAVAPVFGPVMRFVYGSDHAARTVARRLAATATLAPPTRLPSMAGAAGR